MSNGFLPMEEVVGVVVSMLGVQAVVRDLALAQLLWWFPFVFVLVYYATLASLELRGNAATRWQGTCPEARAFLRLYVAAQLAMIPVEALVGQPMMIAHHVVSVVAFGYGLRSGCCHWFGAMSGLSEVSTIFLEGLLLARRFQLPFQIFCGAGLWLTYVVFRLVLFPVIILVFVADAYTQPNRTWRAVGPIKFCVVPFILVILGLSVSWFARIHKGFVAKVLHY